MEEIRGQFEKGGRKSNVQNPSQGDQTEDGILRAWHEDQTPYLPGLSREELWEESPHTSASSPPPPPRPPGTGLLFRMGPGHSKPSLLLLQLREVGIFKRNLSKC